MESQDIKKEKPDKKKGKGIFGNGPRKDIKKDQKRKRDPKKEPKKEPRKDLERNPEKKIEKRQEKDPKRIPEKKEPGKPSKKKRPGRARRIWKRIKIVIAILAALLITICIAAVVLFYPTYKDLRQKSYEILENMNEDTFARAGSTYIYDAQGTAIGKIGNEKYRYVEITGISDHITHGYIAQEDSRFASHHGVDFQATFRAGLILLKNKGAITQGGSTITQQVVKNNLLTQERTYERKLMEILLAFQLEKQYSKNQIMEFYCNSNYYGNGCYGVEGASQYYFGKSAKEVTLAEAAMLVGTSNSPNRYNPVADYEKAMEKKTRVLGNMLECGYITQEEHDQALLEEPEIVQKTQSTVADNYMISYAIHCMALELMKRDDFEFQYQFDTQEAYEAYRERYKAAYNTSAEKVRHGGYHIYTSFDTGIQKTLQQSVNNGLSSFDTVGENGKYEMQGAAVCIDNKTQMVVAIVGGRGDTDDAFNRGFLAVRQPGSCIKPLLVYGPALDQGLIYPGDVYEDKLFSVNGYAPENADGRFRGNVTVREALARSLNTVALQIFTGTGRKESLSYLDALHFSSLCYADSTVDTIALGGFTNGVSVSDMARGYATIANGGSYSEKTCILRVLDAKDREIYSCEDTKDQEVYNKDTAYILTDVMQGVFKESYGTAHRKSGDGQYYAGKTGTTNGNKDAWFCGFSKDYTTAVWTGCDTPKRIKGLYGDAYPLTIWTDFMNAIHPGGTSDFKIPSTVKLRYKNGTVKDLWYTDRGYDNRPDDADYVSGILMDEYARIEQQRKEEAYEKETEAAVVKFEEKRIKTTDEARSVDTDYNALLKKIEGVEKESKKQDLKERAAKKYELLQKEVLGEWKALIDAEERAKEEKRQSEIKMNAQKDREEALNRQKGIKLDLINWYLTELKERTHYSTDMEELLKKAQDALNACSAYEEYSKLKQEFDALSTKLRSLPSLDGTTTEVQQGTEAADGASVSSEAN